MSEYRPYANPEHSGNKIRPRIRCIGCGKRGCITAWGPWCFTCNVARIDRINKAFEDELEYRGISAAHSGTGRVGT